MACTFLLVQCHGDFEGTAATNAYLLVAVVALKQQNDKDLRYSQAVGQISTLHVSSWTLEELEHVANKADARSPSQRTMLQYELSPPRALELR